MHFRIFFGCFYLSAAASAVAQMVDQNSVQRSGSELTTTGYRNTFSLAIPSKLSDLHFRIRDGKLQESTDNQSWNIGNFDFYKKEISGDWDGFQVLGAPIFGSDPVKLRETLHSGFRFDVLALGKDSVVEIGSKTVSLSPGRNISELSLFQGNITAPTRELFSSFKINSDSFQFRLGRAIFITDNILAILASTEHPYVNYVVFYDTNKKKPIGFKSFSLIQYLPNENAMRFGEPIPKSISNLPTFDPANIKLNKIQLLDGGQISPDLHSDTLFQF